MRLIIFTLGVFVHFSCFSQVPNDDCFNASPLGALPAPANCGNGPNNDGQGDPVTFTNLTNVGAQTENPYTTLINCQGSGQDMASPATDVWYSFVPTGLSLDITINGLINDPNVALWTGNCGTLIGAGCDIGSGGSLTTTIDQLNPGDTYYLQISGGDSNDEGTFDLTLQNNVDCNACLLSSTMIVDPLPLNGTYQPGTIVSFCFTVDEWNQTNTNWFQGVVPIMGSSWTNLTPISSPQTCDSGPGIWDWFNGVTTPLGNSNGFFFDGAIAGFNTIPDGDPTNNFGDNCQGTGLNWEFCWQATVEDCPPGQTGDDLTVNVETYGDGETGNWSDVGCNFDPVFLFSASLACCASPLVFSTNASCQGMNDGFVSTEAQTTANPWDFEWTDDSGNVISTTNNSNSATNVVLNLAEGTYTVTVTDANGCVSSGSIAITAPSIITPLFNQMANICNGDSFSLPNVSTNGINGSWLPTIDNTQTTTYTFSPDVGQCSTTADMTVTVNPQVTGTEAYTGCQGDGYSVDVNGVTYDEGNTTGVEVLMNSNGCDSTVTITLIYNNNTFGTETYTGCQGDGYSVDVNGVTYDEGNPSGTEVLTNSNGCDSTVTITLIYNNNTFGTETYTGCQGDGYSVVVNGVTYDEGNPSGTEVLTNSNSCDSTVTIDLIFNSTLSGTELYTGCQGDGYSVVVNGITYDEGNASGTEVLTAVAGCDSTVTITLIYNNNTFGTETYTGCQGDGYSVDVNGVTYDEGNPSGTEVLTNSNGCDSTVTITLIYNNNTFGTETYTGCQGDGYSVVVNGVTYDEGNPSGTEVLTNSNSCDSTVTIDLIFNTLPTINLLGNDPSVCNASDGSIIISGLIPLTQYTLSYDSFGSSQSFSITTDSFGEYMISGLTAGLYSGFSISLNGCEGTSLDVIDLNNPGAPSIDLQSSITECDTYTLSDITGTNLSGDQGYYTQSNGGGIQLDPGDVITSTQTIYLYDVLGSCADESSFTVTIDNTPSIDNPGPQEVCGVYSLPLSIFGSNLSGNESFYNGLQSNGGTIIIDPILVSQTVYIYDENGACSNEVSFDVTVNELPALLGFTGEGTYCDGDVISNLFAEVSGTPEFTLEYTLDGVLHSINSSISSIDLGNTSGVYILTALNDNFCSVLINATQTITINSIPDMPIVSQDTIYCENSEPLDLQVSGGNGSYSWFSDASLSQPIGNSNSFTPSTSLGSTTYYVTTTENGCEGLPSTVTITFESCDIIIPTAFTPNDDSVNDTWELGSIDDIYPSNVVSIYNRWGSKVFESTSGTYNEKPWNGNYNGNKLPVGSYYFIIEFNDNYTLNKTGIVTIITD